MNIVEVIEEPEKLYVIYEWQTPGSLKPYLDKIEYLDESESLFIFK